MIEGTGQREKPSAEAADGFLVWYGDRIKTDVLRGKIQLQPQLSLPQTLDASD